MYIITLYISYTILNQNYHPFYDINQEIIKII